MVIRFLYVLGVLILTLIASSGAGRAQEPGADPDPIADLLAMFSEDSERFTQTDGEALYRAICQACHMENGEGARGVGNHPPLAGNPKMNSKHFVAGVILNGYQGMPPFADRLDDAQVAAITDFVRMRLGNSYTDSITPDQVADLRPPEDED
jgi:mono/diheme cytochrome c family protein